MLYDDLLEQHARGDVVTCMVCHNGHGDDHLPFMLIADDGGNKRHIHILCDIATSATVLRSVAKATGTVERPAGTHEIRSACIDANASIKMRALVKAYLLAYSAADDAVSDILKAICGSKRTIRDRVAMIVARMT